MSRILFSIQVHGKSFAIALGWDRRLRQCFLSVADKDMEDCDYDDERFEAILEASAAGMRQNMGVDDCKAILEKAAVVVPPGTFDVLAEHVRANAGNLIVELDAAGAVMVVHDEGRTASATSAV